MDREKLSAIQKRLAKKVRLKDEFVKIERVAGVDLAYKGEVAFCAVVVLDYNTLEVVEESVIKSRVSFPYIPTFLAFREVRPIIKALNNLKHSYDVLILDGQGIAHPRGLGIASHIGVLLDIPAIGVAKSLLCGEVKGKILVRKAVPLIFNETQVGYALQTKKRTTPIYISPGHKVSLESSLEIVKRCIKDHKLPEPARLAHRLAESKKRM